MHMHELKKKKNILKLFIQDMQKGRINLSYIFFLLHSDRATRITRA